MRKISFDGLVNVAVLTTCVLASSLIVYRFHAESARKSAPQPFTVGAHIEHVSNTAYNRSAQTLLMFVRSTCHFCTESMPLYESLTQNRGAGDQLRFVVAASEPIETARTYLATHRVVVDDITSVRLDVDVPTPTLVLVDRAGVVKGVWVGRLDDRGQRELKTALTKPRA